MTSEQAGALQEKHSGTAWLTTIASLAVGACFFALWFWLLPSWLGFRVDMAGMARWRWIGAVPSVLGFARRYGAYGISDGRDTARRCRLLPQRD